MKNFIITLLLISFNVAGLEALGLETESYTFPDIFFVDESNGWIAGGYWSSEGRLSGIIAHTTDGGNTWTVQLKNPPGTVLRKIWFSDINDGWVIGLGPVETGVFVRTDDGGQNWSWEIDETFYPVSIYLANKNEGWIVKNKHTSGYGKICWTQDGGRSWDIKLNFGVGQILTSAYFLNQKEGWVLCCDGFRTYHTADGGDNWDIHDISGEIAPSSICFIDSQEGWAIGAKDLMPHYVLHTIDGGKNWETLKEFEDTFLTEIYFSNRDEGWIIAEEGNYVMVSNNVILYTHDGGKNWQTQFETEKQRLYGMHFLGNKKGWIIGNNIMLNTVDGGGIWNIMKFPFSSDETDVTPRSKLPITWGFIKRY